METRRDATSTPVFIHGSGFVVGSKDASVQNGVTFGCDVIALFHQIVRFSEPLMRVAVPGDASLRPGPMFLGEHPSAAQATVPSS